MAHTVESIKNLLRTNDKAVARALVALYNRQTADEQNSESTRYSNGEGFTAVHAAIGSSMAKFYMKNGFLTPAQINYWRKPTEKRGMRIELYANQLLRIANQKS